MRHLSDDDIFEGAIVKAMELKGYDIEDRVLSAIGLFLQETWTAHCIITDNLQRRLRLAILWNIITPHHPSNGWSWWHVDLPKDQNSLQNSSWWFPSFLFPGSETSSRER